MLDTSNGIHGATKVDLIGEFGSISTLKDSLVLALFSFLTVVDGHAVLLTSFSHSISVK